MLRRKIKPGKEIGKVREVQFEIGDQGRPPRGDVKAKRPEGGRI